MDPQVEAGLPGEPLPKPVISKVATSERPINEVVDSEGTARKTDIWVLRPFEGYSVLQNHASTQIEIYDSHARRVDDFDEAKGSVAIEVDFQDLGETMGTDFLSHVKHKIHFQNTQDHTFTDELPEGLRQLAEEQIGFQSKRWFNLGRKKIELSGTSLSVVPGGYIVFADGQEPRASIAFKTQNDSGSPLPPRNWKRIEWDLTYPKDLEPYSHLLHRKDNRIEMIRDLEGPYFVGTSDDALEIFSEVDGVPATVFRDEIREVDYNICQDPTDQSVIYYCSSNNPTNLVRLNLSGEPSTWRTESVRLPGNYEEVHNLQLDPTGQYFLIDTGSEFRLFTKNTLEEVLVQEGLSNAHFDSQGRARAVNGEGNLEIHEVDFTETTKGLRARRGKRLESINVGDMFAPEGARPAPEVAAADFEYLDPTKDEVLEVLKPQVAAATTIEETEQLLDRAWERILSTSGETGLAEDERAYIMKAVDGEIKAREREIAGGMASEVFAIAETTLAGGASLTQTTELRDQLNELHDLGDLLGSEARSELRVHRERTATLASELFRQESTRWMNEITGVVDGARNNLAGITSQAGFEEWRDTEYTRLTRRLAEFASLCPAEATDAHDAIVGARRGLQELAVDHEMQFREQYEQVRARARTGITETAAVISGDIDGLLERVRHRGFTDRADAERYLEGSEGLKALDAEIEALAARDPDVAGALRKQLRVLSSVLLGAIERGAMVEVEPSGQQMVYFEDTAFPKWEGEVRGRGEKQVNLTFIVNEASKGAGIPASQVYGDVGLEITTSMGRTEVVRLYEGLPDEGEWRYGVARWRGSSLPSSYVTVEEYQGLKRDLANWDRGDDSKLQAELAKRREALRDHYKGRKPRSEREATEDETWQARYRELLEELGSFNSEHHIALLRRIDKVREAPETQFANGKGFIPEWQSHWVMDQHTEANLEEMARFLNMQRELQEGILNLVGHAGTGKDVLVKMFAERTGRPYFAMDCTKWTTEFELSEDIILEAEAGASQTVKVPSVVLNAIRTPGAIMYFNEISAMTEQAQIFLHALMDEKRALTLKTSSGETVKADQSVLLISSMNPGYPGTFNPQYATRSRMVTLNVDYPPLQREKAPDDTNPNPPYDASEALRIAREVGSFTDLTYEVNAERNEFVQIWDRHINGINNGAPDLTPVQQFDLEVILGLVQFGNTLREHFIRQFKGGAGALSALPVTQPITGREMRRCAWALSRMAPGDKIKADSETVAKGLLERFFLSHIDDVGDREKIETALAAETSKKRPAA